MADPSSDPNIAAQLLYPPNIAHNTSLASVKFIAACFTGAAAGILRLTNYAGFLFFAVSVLLTAVSIGVIGCGGKPGKYVKGGWQELVMPSQENISTFVLVWTLFYGVVHVYD